MANLSAKNLRVTICTDSVEALQTLRCLQKLRASSQSVADQEGRLTSKSLLIKLSDTSFPAFTVIPCHLFTSVPGVSQPSAFFHRLPPSELKMSTKAWLANRRIRTTPVYTAEMRSAQHQLQRCHMSFVPASLGAHQCQVLDSQLAQQCGPHGAYHVVISTPCTRSVKMHRMRYEISQGVYVPYFYSSEASF